MGDETALDQLRREVAQLRDEVQRLSDAVAALTPQHFAPKVTTTVEPGTVRDWLVGHADHPE